jgi:hypothetical protein
MWPQQAAPAFGRSLDNKRYIINISVTISVNIQPGRDKSGNPINRIYEQLVLP